MSIKKDIIGAEVQIGTNQAQQGLTELSKETAKYNSENERLRLIMKKLEVQGKKNSKEWKEAKSQLDKNKVAIKENQLRMEDYRKKLGLSSLSLKQLRARMRDVKRQLDQTTPNTPEWDKYNKELKETRARYSELNTHSRKTQGFLGKLKGAAGGLLPAFGIAGIITGLFKIGKGLLDISTKIEAVNRKAKIVFGQNFDELAANAEKNAKRIGLSITQYIEAATNTADLLVPLQFTREEAAKMSEQLVELSGALSEWSGGMLTAAEVAEIQTKALLGETEQMKQLGIVIDQSSKSYNNRIAQLQESENLTKEQARAIDIFNQIMEKSTDAQNAFYEDGLKLLRTRKTFSVFWSNLKDQVADWAKGVVERWIYAGDWFKKWANDMKKAANTLLPKRWEFDTKSITEFGSAILYGDYALQKLTKTISKYGIESEQGIEASNKLREELEKRYGKEGIDLFNKYMDEQETMLQRQKDNAEEERQIIEQQRQERIKEANQKEAAEALEIANKQRILSLTEQYASEETLQKEFQARLLANELSYLQAKASLETDEAKSLDLQTKILQVQQKYNEALKATVPELVNKSTTVDFLNTKLLEESKLLDLITKQEQKAATDQEELNDKLMEQAQRYQNTIQMVSDSIFDLTQGGEDAFKNFAKNMLIMALEELKVYTQLAVAKVTIGSLASAESIATFGAAGLAKAALLTGLIEAAFAGIEGLVAGAFSDKGKKQGGYTGFNQSDDTVMGVYHANEFVANAQAVRNPSVKSVLDIIDIAQRNGNIATLNLPAILGTGKKTGGYSENTQAISGANPTQPYTPDPEIKELLIQNTRVMERLMQWELPITDVKKSLNKLKQREKTKGM